MILPFTTRRPALPLLRVFARLPHGSESDAAEARLVAAAKYGDSDAFDALVERYAPRLHAVARRMVGEDQAADVVQDAFLAAFKSLRRFRGNASFSTYLHTIVINRCKRLSRRLSRRREQLPLDEAVFAERPDGPTGPERSLDSVLTREGIEQALRALPEPFREALSLREFSGLSYAEIAAVLAVEEGTVKSRIARARRQLREVLEAAGVRP